MKQNKKPTYKELEEETNAIRLCLVFLMIIIGILLFLWITNYTRAESFKSQLNLTEGNYNCEWKQIAVNGDNFNLYFETELVFNSSEQDLKPSFSFMIEQCEVIK